MRITTSMYFKQIYGENNSQLTKKLFDVNKQIASGVKIQYAKDDIKTFVDTMRLDNEIVTLAQIKKSTDSGYKVSDQSDSILNDMEDTIIRGKTIFLQAANGTNDESSLDAVAKELRGMEQNIMNLANASINGKYLFSGSAVDIRPIADDGTYMGNDVELNAFTGSRISQQYNVSGGELFLGENSQRRREITTNVVQNSLTIKYPDYTDPTIIGKISPTSSSSTIRDLMGDSDNAVDVGTQKHFFYIRGTKSDGTAFEQKLSMSDDETVDNLLTKVGEYYGNTPALKVVNVSMNPSGQIVIEDKIKGSSKLDFHMVGAVDFGGTGAADVAIIDDLGVGEQDFEKIMLGTSTATNQQLHVKEFVKSSLTSASSVAATNIIEGTVYDRTEFTIDGAKLSSSTPQILRDGNAFASPSTKISEVADLSQGTAGTLDGTTFNMVGTNVAGAAYSATIDLASGGSTFTVNGSPPYTIYNMQSSRGAVDADEMTYQQLMDVMNMIVTDTLPDLAGTHTHPDLTPYTAEEEYDYAVDYSYGAGNTALSYDGKIKFEEIGPSTTKASISIYDSNSGNFGVANTASVMTFNTNNTLTVRDAKTDFFKSLNEAILAVENYSSYPDSESGDIRSLGIQNALSIMDDLQDHVSRAHSKVGSQSNALSISLERTASLEIASITLRSSVIDTDLAEASLTLTQLSHNYEAMLSTVGKISKLSLVNYL